MQHNSCLIIPFELITFFFSFSFYQEMIWENNGKMDRSNYSLYISVMISVQSVRNRTFTWNSWRWMFAFNKQFSPFFWTAFMQPIITDNLALLCPSPTVLCRLPVVLRLLARNKILQTKSKRGPLCLSVESTGTQIFSHPLEAAVLGNGLTCLPSINVWLNACCLARLFLAVCFSSDKVLPSLCLSSAQCAEAHIYPGQKPRYCCLLFSFICGRLSLYGQSVITPLEALVCRFLFFSTNNTPIVQLCFLIHGFLGPSVLNRAFPF